MHSPGKTERHIDDLENTITRLEHRMAQAFADIKVRDTRIAELEGEQKKLREALAMAYSGPTRLYGDDGHLTDSSASPFIDYRNDSVDEIRAKIRERGRQAAEAAKGGE